MARPDAAAPELPGFTYDEARGRYVRILADHHAGALGGAASAASASAVKRAGVFQKRRKDEEERTASRVQGQIRRSRIHKHAIVGMSLDRQTGMQGFSPDLHGRAWAYTIEPNWALKFTYVGPCCMIKKKVEDDGFVGFHRWEDGSSRLRLYSEDPEQGVIANACHNIPIFGRLSSFYVFQDWVYVTTFARDTPNWVILTHDEFSVTRERFRRIPKPVSQHDYWCTSLHPSKQHLAVGSEHSVLVHDSSVYHTRPLREYKLMVTSSPTLSIQWKSENVIATGLRDATVHLFDVRARDKIFRLRHGQAVMRLHCPDEHKLLLGGPKQLSMYDLRYNKTPHKQRTSRPWLHYRDYDNTTWNGHDMDISPRLGLLALTLETTVEIWNLWTGAKVRQLCRSPTPLIADKTSIMVSFTRPQQSPVFFTEKCEPTGVLVAGSNSALEWGLDSVASEDMRFDFTTPQELLYP